LPAGAGLPRSSGAAPGAPQGYLAALPSLVLPSSPLSASSAGAFYFLDQDSHGSHGRQGFPGTDAPGRPALPGLSGAELPGGTDLRHLLAGSDSTLPGAPHGLPADAASGSHFYFIDAVPAAVAPLPTSPGGAAGLDVNLVRRDFPILKERVNGKQLIWFDNAATTQKPQAVIDRLAYFYEHENSNIHRAAHELAARATDAYESARQKVADFLGAASPEEIIFVRGTTEAINLIAKTYGKGHVGPGDDIIVSHLEHHANIVPWQQLAQEQGANLKVIPVDDDGQVRLDAYRSLLGPRTRIVSVTQVSNALGTVTPMQEIVAMAHSVGAVAIVDGAQSVSHMPTNVRALDADFFVFSGHKVFGPTGIGAIYGKKRLLDVMPPWQGGGNMIVDVTFEHTIYQPAPARFEAGTGNIADAVGLGAAIDYVQALGMERIGAYEHGLLDYATHRMLTIPGLRLIGTAREKASVLSFVLEGYAPDEVGRAFNREGIAVRSGHHCAQPILRRFGLEATVRPSLAFYNTCAEVDCMIDVLRGLTRRPGPR
jgi:cysteine desulfurase/selenocysteine lyase